MYTGDEWIFKLEAIHRDGQYESTWAAGGGLEYTFAGINDSNADLGVLMEHQYDERTAKQAALQNDLFTGVRLAMNDMQSFELLAGFGVDMDAQSQSIRIEASRRFGDNLKINLETQFFNNIETTNILSDYRNNDYLKLEVVWYF